MKDKVRLDKLLVDRNLVKSRQQAQALIMAGEVFVNDQKADKAGRTLPADADVEVRSKAKPYSSRGGLKLEGALAEFNLEMTGLICLDVGQSTGGFTDCLLQKGAAKVTGVDVGYGQVDLKLRNDPRVTVIERTNFRHFDPATLPELVELSVVDVSFISLTLILPVVKACLKPGGKILALIKPQFEVGKKQVGSGGVVRDPEMHQIAVDKVCNFAKNELELSVLGVIDSPILGPKGNKEFFCLLEKPAWKNY